MMRDGERWAEDETLFLFRVFLSEPASSLSTGSPLISKMGDLLGRTPHSVHRKLEDIRSNEPSYIASGRKPTNCASLVKDVWSSLYSDYDRTAACIDNAYLAVSKGSAIVSEMSVEPEVQPGQDIPVEATCRGGQQVFRRLVAGNFDRRCCITGLAAGELLVASHIKPWAESSPFEKTDPCNGLYLNRLHDALFDRHLMTLDEDMRVVYADSVRDRADADTFESLFGRYEGLRIRDPVRSPISETYLGEHRAVAYRQWGRA